MNEEKRRSQKDEIQWRYWDKKLSRKVAAALLKDLKYEDWEINLFLDNDQTGPE
jgi:hypothetical protein